MIQIIWRHYSSRINRLELLTRELKQQSGNNKYKKRPQQRSLNEERHTWFWLPGVKAIILKKYCCCSSSRWKSTDRLLCEDTCLTCDVNTSQTHTVALAASLPKQQWHCYGTALSSPAVVTLSPWIKEGEKYLLLFWSVGSVLLEKALTL